tara:strand:- start:498 stop:743 length:246 start_codon:yes stop_codon:yes gene_type:complete
MQPDYYNNITPQTKEGVDFPLNHVDLSLEQEAFVESIYESKEMQLKKEEIMELVHELKFLTPDDLEFMETIEEINDLLEDL